jgi:hypothetical protein
MQETQLTSGLIVVTEPKPAPPTYDARLLQDAQSLLQEHPAPWTIGECHESKADLRDGKGRFIASVHTMLGISPEQIAALIVTAVNAYARQRRESDNGTD